MKHIINSSQFSTEDFEKLFETKINKIPKLSREEEYNYTKLSKDGITEKERICARNKLIETCITYLFKISKKYCYLYYVFNGIHLNVFDLIDEGYLGLIKAAENFNPDKRVPFIVYGKQWMHGKIGKYLKDYKLSPKTQKNSEEKIYKKSGGKSDIEEFKYFFKNYFQDVLSLDELYDKIDEAIELVDDRDTDFAYRMLEIEFVTNEIYNAISLLTKQESDIIKKIYGLGAHKSMTFKQVGDEYNLSDDRIRQIVEKAIHRMKTSKTIQKLKVYT